MFGEKAVRPFCQQPGGFSLAQLVWESDAVYIRETLDQRPWAAAGLPMGSSDKLRVPPGGRNKPKEHKQTIVRWMKTAQGLARPADYVPDHPLPACFSFAYNADAYGRDTYARWISGEC